MGIFLKAASPTLLRRPFLFEVEPGVLVPGELDDFMFLHYFVYGLSRDPAFRLARDLVRAGDTVVDVGANLGFWVMGVARRAGPRSVVHALEPFPRNLERLRKYLELNGLTWVVAHPLAAGASPGEMAFSSPAGANSGLGFLSSTASEAEITVKVTTLDAFCEQQGIAQVDLLKIDIEGAEVLAFRGARTLLGSDGAPIVMLEVGDALAARFGATSSDAKALLASLGYRIFQFDGQRLREVAVAAEHPMSEDLFALKAAHFRQRPLLERLHG